MRRGLSTFWKHFKTHSPFGKFPLGPVLRGYDRVQARADAIAGVNVALMAFPTGMAYAMIAGLPVYYGIYCSVMASLIAPLFGHSRLAIPGPTNATSVLILSSLLFLPPGLDREVVISALVLMVGVMLVVASHLRVANLTQYVSRSVIIGYTTGAALLILANQAHYLFGLQITSTPAFMDICMQTLRNLPHTDFFTLGFAGMTWLAWLVMKRYGSWLPCAAGTLIAMTLVARLGDFEQSALDYLPPLPASGWLVTMPALDFSLFNQLARPAAAIALFATLEATFTIKSLAGRTGDRLDINQDLLGLGMANVGASFLAGMPASVSPIRSTLNWSSGARTPLASFYSGLLCMAGIFLFGSAIGYIPKASLALVVIISACELVDWARIRVTLRATKSDAAVFTATLLATLLTPLDFAIFFGVAISIALYLRKASHPVLVEYTFNEQGNLREVEEKENRTDPQISIIHVEGELFFGAAELFRDEIRRVCADPQLQVVILRLKNAHHLDATSVLALQELLTYLRSTGRHLLISGATRDVYRVLKNSGLSEELGKENFFLASAANPNLSTRHALQRAKELMGGKSTSVRIFYDPAKKDAEGRT